MNDRFQAMLLNLLVRLGVVKPIPLSATTAEREAQRRRDARRRR